MKIPMKTDFEDKLANFVWEHAVAPMAFVAKDGTFLRVNPALSELLGYTTLELTNLRFHDITHPQDIEADQDMVDACLAGKINGYSMTKRYITKRGESIWIRLRVDVVTDDDTGEIALFFSQITPKEDPARIDTHVNNDLSVPTSSLTVSDIGAWLRTNWKSITPILASIGFVIFYIIKYFMEYNMDKTQ